MNYSVERVAKEIVSHIDEALSRTGLFYRIFWRIKSKHSTEKKITDKKYKENGKKIQDLIGIRTIFYFEDDVPIFQSYIDKLFHLDPDNCAVDIPDEKTFGPSRINLVLKLPVQLVDEFRSTLRNDLIDNTFELQIRTILSEGWHEVEHDLRYKCRTDWELHDDLSRILNGVYASLVANEWSMSKIFNELAHGHYKASNWTSMLRQKFRIRFAESQASPAIIELLDTNPDLAKAIYRADRAKVIRTLFNRKIFIPVTFDNIIFLTNHLLLRNDEIASLTPDVIADELKDLGY